MAGNGGTTEDAFGPAQPCPHEPCACCGTVTLLHDCDKNNIWKNSIAFRTMGALQISSSVPTEREEKVARMRLLLYRRMLPPER